MRANPPHCRYLSKVGVSQTVARCLGEFRQPGSTWSGRLARTALGVLALPLQFAYEVAVRSNSFGEDFITPSSAFAYQALGLPLRLLLADLGPASREAPRIRSWPPQLRDSWWPPPGGPPNLLPTLAERVLASRSLIRSLLLKLPSPRHSGLLCCPAKQSNSVT